MSIASLKGDRGASAVLVAFTLLVIMGFAAVAIDLAVGYNQRRQDQTAADVGVMAGAIETLGPNTLIRNEILDFTRRNVIASYTDADWRARWEACSDPELAGLNSSGYHFIPVAAPGGWSVATLDCISFDAGGFIRVNLPELEFDTTFGRLLGVDTLQTSADAIAVLGNRGGGGILPFGLLSTASDGEHACLRDSSGGLAQEPCDGPDAGNFGAIESPFYGTKPDGPARNCTGSPKKDILAVNLAFGIDHRVIPHGPPLNTSVEVEDTCANMDNGRTPDTLNTFQGISGGLAEGLAIGPVPNGIALPRLQQGSNPKKSVYGNSLDNRGMWHYIDGAVTAAGGADIPPICEKSTFNNSSNPAFDWDGDGTPDNPESWQHLTACLTTYATGDGGAHSYPYTGVLFLDTLNESPRFGYVPQFWESTYGSGNSWRHVARFKATWLQATWWKKGSTTTVFHPGEAGTFSGSGNWSLIQLSGIIIPDNALPTDLRGTPGPSGGLSPFVPELFR
jgi:hypothetical protein